MLALNEYPFFPTRETLRAICLVGLFGVQENLEDDMSTLSLVWKIVNPQLKVTFLILMSFLILVV